MDGYITIGTELDTKSFDAQIDYVKQQMEDIEDKLKQADMGFEVGDVTKLEAQYEKLTAKLGNLIKKKEELNRTDLSQFQASIDSVGNSTSKVIKKIAKWGLAVFGIRTAYNFVRQAISTLSGENEQLAADIEYIRYAIASTLQPVIERLIQLVYKLLQYVNYIAQAWFGVNIFANANAKALNKAVGSAKQLNKQLAGFDEMNVLSDTSGGGGAESSAMPSVDLTKLQGEVPSWLQWIADNGPLIISILGGIASGLIAVRLGAQGIMALGIGTAIAGIVYAILSLIDYIKDPSWSKFGDIVIGIGVAVLGLGIAFLGLPGIIAGAIVIILGIIAKFWDKINEFLENLVSNIFKKGDDIMNWLQEHLGIFGTILNVFVGTIIGVITSIIEAIRSLFDGLFTGVRQILDGIIMIFKGNFKEGIVTIFKGIANIIIGVLNTLISGLNAVISPIRALIVAVGKVMGKGWTMDNIKIPKIPKLAKGGIINMPGRGVPVGSALAGERGREAVLPLQDTQVLQEIADAIGSRININATVPVYVGNRMVARELKRINAEDNFAYNR